MSFSAFRQPFILSFFLVAAWTAAAVPANAQTKDAWPMYGYHWVGAWGASPSAPFGSTTTPAMGGSTLRLTAHMSLSATSGIRIRLSNAQTSLPVTLQTVHIALWAGSATHITPAIITGSDRVVTFDSGSGSVTIAASSEVVSDPISFTVPAGQDIAVSVYVAPGSPEVTWHGLANAMSYIAPGNQTAGTTLTSYTTTASRAYLSGIEVLAPVASAAVVMLGDSITDGALSTMDGDVRWPDDLGVRLQAAYGDKVGIVNAGIAGNRILLDSTTPSALSRFNRDVLSVPGVKYVVLFEGTNDIGNDPNITSAQLIAGMQSVIARAHDADLYIYGATITPDLGYSYYTPAHEQIRQDVNTFIRNIGAFDGVIDFDAAIRDPSNPAQILPKYQGDKIHPNTAGYQAMANVVNLMFFDPYTH